MPTERTVRENFVPEEGISGAVLQARLTAWFGPGAKIQKKLRSETDEVGWLVIGGRVTPAILENLRKETQKREQEAARAQQRSASTVSPSHRTIRASTDKGRTPNSSTGEPPSAYQPEDAATGTRGQRANRGREDDDDDDDPDYGQQRI